MAILHSKNWTLKFTLSTRPSRKQQIAPQWVAYLMLSIDYFFDILVLRILSFRLRWSWVLPSCRSGSRWNTLFFLLISFVPSTSTTLTLSPRCCVGVGFLSAIFSCRTFPALIWLVRDGCYFERRKGTQRLIYSWTPATQSCLLHEHAKEPRYAYIYDFHHGGYVSWTSSTSSLLSQSFHDENMSLTSNALKHSIRASSASRKIVIEILLCSIAMTSSSKPIEALSKASSAAFIAL